MLFCLRFFNHKKKSCVKNVLHEKLKKYLNNENVNILRIPNKVDYLQQNFRTNSFFFYELMKIKTNYIKIL